MSKTKELLVKLEGAIDNPASLTKAIVEFQKIVWSKDNLDPAEDEEAWEILRDLAYDLEFYEADPKARIEDASFYSDDRAVEEIREARHKLEQLNSI